MVANGLSEVFKAENELENMMASAEDHHQQDDAEKMIKKTKQELEKLALMAVRQMESKGIEKLKEITEEITYGN